MNWSDVNGFLKNSGANRIVSLLNNSTIKSLSQTLQQIRTKTPNLSNSQIYTKVPKFKFPNIKLEENILEEKEKINELLSEVYLHQERVAYLYNRLSCNPQYSKIISYSIYISLFLIITCISIPLLILPTDEYITLKSLPKILLEGFFSGKGVFVSISTILICLIFVIFLKKNNSMQYPKETMQKLEEMSKLENYSEYLKNYIQNTEEK